jgi:ribosomal-protein-alanine N-acetyltransferase
MDNMNTFPTLTTEHLALVEIQQSHLSDIYLLFSDRKVTEYYNLLPLKEEQDGQKLLDWFRNRFKDGLGIRWGIALKGTSTIIGTIGFNNFTAKHQANIGYDLQSAYWNRGYMTEALRIIIDFGFNELDVNRIEAEVMQGNVISEKLLEKLNFRRDGVLRQWMLWNEQYYDMTMYSLLRTDYDK